MHAYCPPALLAWPRRKQLLLAELLSFRADVLCLQEASEPALVVSTAAAAAAAAACSWGSRLLRGGRALVALRRLAPAHGRAHRPAAAAGCPPPACALFFGPCAPLRPPAVSICLPAAGAPFLRGRAAAAAAAARLRRPVPGAAAQVRRGPRHRALGLSRRVPQRSARGPASEPRSVHSSAARASPRAAPPPPLHAGRRTRRAYRRRAWPCCTRQRAWSSAAARSGGDVRCCTLRLRRAAPSSLALLVLRPTAPLLWALPRRGAGHPPRGLPGARPARPLLAGGPAAGRLGGVRAAAGPCHAPALCGGQHPPILGPALPRHQGERAGAGLHPRHAALSASPTCTRARASSCHSCLPEACSLPAFPSPPRSRAGGPGAPAVPRRAGLREAAAAAAGEPRACTLHAVHAALRCAALRCRAP